MATKNGHTQFNKNHNDKKQTIQKGFPFFDW